MFNRITYYYDPRVKQIDNYYCIFIYITNGNIPILMKINQSKNILDLLEITKADIDLYNNTFNTYLDKLKMYYYRKQKYYKLSIFEKLIY